MVDDEQTGDIPEAMETDSVQEVQEKEERIATLEAELEREKQTCVALQNQLTMERFGISRFTNDNKLISFYTGFSLLLKDLVSDFYLTSLQLVLCRMAAVKRLPVHQP